MKLEENNISKEKLMKLKEDDLMFITSPGRMGDVDGSIFVIKKDNEFIMYRVDGLYYGNKDDSSISLEDMFKVFPLWEETLRNLSDENYNEKYIFIPMGFGNGLCVDKRIYDEYYPFLLEEVKKQDMYIYEEDENNYNPCLNYPSWIPALEKMIKNK